MMAVRVSMSRGLGLGFQDRYYRIIDIVGRSLEAEASISNCCHRYFNMRNKRYLLGEAA